MANEITFTGSLNVYKAAVMSGAVGRSFQGLLFNMTGSFVTEGVMAVTTAGLAIPLGSVTSPNWFAAINQDATNFLRLQAGSGGTPVVKLRAGQPCIFPWDETQTPWAKADTATVNMEYLIVQL